MFLGASHTMTFRRPQLTGAANRLSAPTKVTLADVPVFIDPVGPESPLAFDAPLGSRHFIYCPKFKTPDDLWAGDEGTDNEGRVFTVVGVAPYEDHLQLVATRVVKQTIAP